MNTMRRNIRRVRQANGQVHPLPADRASMVLPDGITELPNGEFLLFDSGEGDHERLIIFGTQRNLETLTHATSLHMDGTFKIVPQVYF